MSDCNGKCDDCGHFVSMSKSGTSSADIFSFGANPCCEYTHIRCFRCTEISGNVMSNARPHNGDMTQWQSVMNDDGDWIGWT